MSVVLFGFFFLFPLNIIDELFTPRLFSLEEKRAVGFAKNGAPRCCFEKFQNL